MNRAIESLEQRVLLSANPYVTGAVADNRGLINIYFDAPLNATTVTAAGNVTVWTTGGVQIPSTVAWGGGQNRIVVEADGGQLTADTPYVVVVSKNVLGSTNGNLPINGAFYGTFPTGNPANTDSATGTNFRFQATVNPYFTTARFTIQAQSFNVPLYTGVTASTDDFILNADEGIYDGTIIHRTAQYDPSEPDTTYGIIQGGGFYIDGDPNIDERTPAQAGIADQPTYDNNAGTLALANTGQPDSTQNQWYFNVSNNQTQFGANYSVIGAINGWGANSVGQTEVTKIDNYTNLLDLSLDQNPQPTMSSIGGPSRYGTATVSYQLTAVPSTNGSVTYLNADPAADFIIVSRVAINLLVTPVGTVVPAVTPAVAVAQAVPEVVASKPAASDPPPPAVVPIFSVVPIASSAWDNLQLGAEPASLLA